MIHLHTLTSNPGPMAPAEIDPWAILAAVPLTFGLILFLSSLTVAFTARGWEPLCGAVIGAVLVAVGILWIVSGYGAMDERQEAYNTSVSEWLATDYDLDVSPEDAGRLASGYELVTEVNGSRQVITIRENTDDRIELVNQAGDVIAAR